MLSLRFVLVLNGIESGDRRGIPDVGTGEVDDHVRRIVDVVELIDQIVARSEEQLPGHPIDAGIDESVLVGVRFGHLLHIRQMRDAAGEHHHRRQHTQDHADRQIVSTHSRSDRHHHHQRLTLGHQLQSARIDTVPIHGSDGHHDHHRNQSAHRDQRDDVTEPDDENQQEHTGQERRDAGAGAGDLHVDHRLPDHRATAHATEEPGDQVRHTLPPLHGSCSSECR